MATLVWAVVYVFGVKHGIGNDTLSEFSICCA
jgi:hypothetical protein